ncbi:hypothetical protein V7138_15055 [Bacillus sp. JJ1533]|uniref:hypothetical protein n=1 Tax=Bacillus sp. JJ1533 TaxID=3122959 RepID=UPI002FFF2E84
MILNKLTKNWKKKIAFIAGAIAIMVICGVGNEMQRTSHKEVEAETTSINYNNYYNLYELEQNYNEISDLNSEVLDVYRFSKYDKSNGYVVLYGQLEDLYFTLDEFEVAQGAKDTYDLSGYISDAVINLRESVEFAMKSLNADNQMELDNYGYFLDKHLKEGQEAIKNAKTELDRLK